MKEPEEIVVIQVLVSVFLSLDSLVIDGAYTKLERCSERLSFGEEDGVIKLEGAVIERVLVGCNCGFFDRDFLVSFEGSESAL